MMRLGSLAQGAMPASPATFVEASHHCRHGNDGCSVTLSALVGEPAHAETETVTVSNHAKVPLNVMSASVDEVMPSEVPV